MRVMPRRPPLVPLPSAVICGAWRKAAYIGSRTMAGSQAAVEVTGLDTKNISQIQQFSKGFFNGYDNLPPKSTEMENISQKQEVSSRNL